VITSKWNQVNNVLHRKVFVGIFALSILSFLHVYNQVSLASVKGRWCNCLLNMCHSLLCHVMSHSKLQNKSHCFIYGSEIPVYTMNRMEEEAWMPTDVSYQKGCKYLLNLLKWQWTWLLSLLCPHFLSIRLSKSLQNVDGANEQKSTLLWCLQALQLDYRFWTFFVYFVEHEVGKIEGFVQKLSYEWYSFWHFAILSDMIHMGYTCLNQGLGLLIYYHTFSLL
jgi:hypothetical protein